MFEFFIALFGGAYYGTRVINEKSSNKKYKRDSENRKNWAVRLCNMDGCVEKEIRDALSNAEKRQEILESINSDLVFVFGKSWKSLLSNYDGNIKDDMRLSIWAIVYSILLSENGFTTLSSRLGQELNLVNEQHRYWIIKAYMIIERNLKKKYPELSVVFCPGINLSAGCMSTNLALGSINLSYSIDSNRESCSLQHIIEHGRYI